MLIFTPILLLLIQVASQSPAESARLHIKRSFTIVLNAPPAVAARAFGPIEEQRWEPEFKPVFVYPSQPNAVEGAVFTVKRRNVQVWLLQTFDMQRYVVRYVAVDPGTKITEIAFHLAPWGAHKSRTTVSYTWTSLTAAEDANVSMFGKHFVGEASHWENTLNRYLSTRALQ